MFSAAINWAAIKNNFNPYLYKVNISNNPQTSSKSFFYLDDFILKFSVNSAIK